MSDAKKARNIFDFRIELESCEEDEKGSLLVKTYLARSVLDELSALTSEVERLKEYLEGCNQYLIGMRMAQSVELNEEARETITKLSLKAEKLISGGKEALDGDK